MTKEVGRPRKFSSVKKLQEKIDQYFRYCEKNKKPLTVTGLANFLDTTRRTLLDYEIYSQEYSHALKRAKSRIEQYFEERLITCNNPAGTIFALKNNFQWQDRTIYETEGKVGYQLTIVMHKRQKKVGENSAIEAEQDPKTIETQTKEEG